MFSEPKTLEIIINHHWESLRVLSNYRSCVGARQCDSGQARTKPLPPAQVFSAEQQQAALQAHCAVGEPELPKYKLDCAVRR